MPYTSMCRHTCSNMAKPRMPEEGDAPAALSIDPAHSPRQQSFECSTHTAKNQRRIQSEGLRAVPERLC
jgi:hypothetical protein